MKGLAQPVLAGAVASFVGFASAFAVVLAGLRSVGASPAQAASGLLVVCVLMGAATIVLSVRTRIPILLAWSTPGAALLVSADVPAGGYPAAVGGFVVCGALYVLTGLSGTLRRLVSAVPLPLAGAMLAGVLLPLCLAPVHAAVDIPGSAAPVLATWAVLSVAAPRWVVPGILGVAIGVVLLGEPLQAGPTGVLPEVTLTRPDLTLAALVGIALPLYIVTMASQNVPGMGVLRANGYPTPLRAVMLTTGLGCMASAAAGVFSANFAAITAALTAGPSAHPDPARRWVAAVASGATYVVLGLGVGLATSLVASAPEGLIEAVAGLALLGTLSSSLRLALGDELHREPALVTFVVTASGITALGISSAFWGLLAGLVLLGVVRAGALLPGRVPAP